MRKTIACLLAFAAGCGVAGAYRLQQTGRGRRTGPGSASGRRVRDDAGSRVARGGRRRSGRAEASGTGWGTLSGTFKLVGDPPAPRKLVVDKDTEVCGKGQGITDNSLLVGSDKGIANVVLYARAKRVHESAQPLKGESGPEVLFDQKGCMFLTHVMAFQLGDKVDDQEQRSGRAQHQDRSGQGHRLQSDAAPTVSSVNYPASARRQFRPRCRAASIPGCGPTCCRARTSILP